MTDWYESPGPNDGRAEHYAAGFWVIIPSCALNWEDMPFCCRPVDQQDFARICGFPQNVEELFFLFPRAVYPLTPSQMCEAVSQRSDSTVVEFDGKVVAFANFYRWETGGCCAIGNVVVAPAARGRGAGRYLIE